VSCSQFEPAGGPKGKPPKTSYPKSKNLTPFLLLAHSSLMLPLNYDISEPKEIVPIGVSTFSEYIHSRDFLYWLTSVTPRVLAPSEVKAFVEKNDFSKTMNRRRIEPVASENLKMVRL